MPWSLRRAQATDEKTVELDANAIALWTHCLFWSGAQGPTASSPAGIAQVATKFDVRRRALLHIALSAPPGRPTPEVDRAMTIS